VLKNVRDRLRLTAAADGVSTCAELAYSICTGPLLEVLYPVYPALGQGLLPGRGVIGTEASGALALSARGDISISLACGC